MDIKDYNLNTSEEKLIEIASQIETQASMARPEQKTLYLNYILELLKLKRQRKESFRLVLATWALVLITVLGTIFYPIYRDNKNLKTDIGKFYKAIELNEDSFIKNTNNLDSFKKEINYNTLPISYVSQDIVQIQNKLQKEIGLTNFQFFLYYLQQTEALNGQINRLKNDVLINGFSSKEIIENKNSYIKLMEYLSKEKWDETKFSYLVDTECLLKILQESFPYLTTKRNEKISCSNDTLNRIFYHFGFLKDETPKWMKEPYQKALQERGINAWWIDDN